MNNILKFLESINDGKDHKPKHPYALDVFENNDPEIMMILNLQKEGLVEFNTGLLHGHPTILSYYITDKGIKFVKDHTESKFHKGMKKFFESKPVITIILGVIGSLIASFIWS